MNEKFILMKIFLLVCQSQNGFSFFLIFTFFRIHLNWGDDGIKNFFKKISKLLNKNGILVLEPQKFSTYDRKKDLTTVFVLTFIF